MIGILVALAASWLLLKFVAREPITVLGIVPNPHRLKEFLVGFGFMALVAVINFMAQAYFKQTSYSLNPDYGVMQFLGAFGWVLRAVVFEELVFRGALLYLLIRFIGPIWGCLLSAAAFGVYHWFSYGLIGGRLIVLIYVFLVTGAGGWMFAYAFAKTKSLFAPIGLHLGWNFVTAIVFSSAPVAIGQQLLLPQGEPAQTNDWDTLFYFTLQAIIAPGLVTWYLRARYRFQGLHGRIAG